MIDPSAAELGAVVLRTTTDETFAIAVGAAVTDVLGPVDGLSSPDAAVRVSAARTALDNAVAVGRAGAETP